MERVHGSEYWIRKLSRNVERDVRVNRELSDLGWNVIRVWESEIRTGSDNVAARIREVVKG
jgi:DNA mismatch endonuclease (patch repair protein)